MLPRHAPAAEPEPEVEPVAQAFQESVTVADNGEVEHPPPPAEDESPAAVTTNGDSPANEDELHRPRSCHLKIWPHFQGYGFNLHAERDKPGQFIGLVDDGSPAQAAGLRVNDRIVEVNGVNVESQAHPEVIARIKAVPNETRLLVVDRETDAYYKDRGVTVHSDMPQVDVIVAQEGGSAAVTSANVEVVDAAADTVAEPEAEVVVAAPVVDTPEEPEEEKKEEEESKEDEKEEAKEEEEKEEESAPKEEENEVKKEEEEVEVAVVPEVQPEPEPEPEPANDPEPVNGISSAPAPEPEPTPAPEPEPEFAVAPAPAPTPAPEPTPAPASADGLELNLSVAEMKERLKQRKKQDPRASKMTFEQKYKDFERM
ncbi:Na(+)/H(+) exchange regulatory cofactor NHE-RF2 [Elysia marginata]|uniref:Na(+)/H(+) exchange regulatory cofactor NHE-RF2 n=1 Tax=Elysia marginata TaxID=1093978 RepID=A0AAV4HU92_9GAST|nr:Na(+)/H(+) exchange regulatory cofactor NHE-RF2 [Elysia marginata]